ncbi:hypothetical protein CLA18_12930 [Pseudomonas protegens]|nr:hypothetical protein CLA18_12930 [Pseudomonas protegens]
MKIRRAPDVHQADASQATARGSALAEILKHLADAAGPCHLDCAAHATSPRHEPHGLWSAA